MLLLLVSWLFLGWLSLVLGVSVLKMAARYLKEESKLVEKVSVDYLLLFGFTATTFLCSIISLVSPINYWVNAVFLLLGVWLHYQNRVSIRYILKGLKKGWDSCSAWLKLAITLACFVPLLTVIIEVGETDTWFYHAQAIQWIKEYPAVPGLGNIHGRFAFNSNYFLVSAFYALLYSEEYLIFPIFSFFFMVLNIRLLTNIQKSILDKNGRLFILNAILLVLFDFHTIDLVSSTSTDVIACVLIFYIFFLFLESAFRKDRPFEQLILWTTVALAITFKLSSLLIVFLLFFTLPGILKSRKLPLFIGMAILIALPFVARNIVLSGYILYPVPSLDILSVDWKIPIEEVQLEKDLVEGWAKQPYGSTYMEKFEDIPKILALSFGEWMEVWWPAQSKKWKAFMLLNLLTIPFLFWTLIRKNYKYAILFSTLIFNLVFWFDQAPQPRFAYGFLFFGAALILAFSLEFFLKLVHPRQLVFPIIGLFLAGLVFIRQDTVFTEINGPSFLAYPTYQTKIKTETFETRNFTLKIPSEEPPASIYWCFNAPLPCTPLPKRSLSLRGTSFRQGFRVSDVEE